MSRSAARKDDNGVHASLDPERVPADADTPSDAVEIIELEVRESRSRGVTATRSRFGSSLAHSVGDAAMSLSLRAVRASLSAGRHLYRTAADSAPVQLLTDAASGALDAFDRDGSIDWRRAEDRVEEQLGRVMAIVAPVVVQSVAPVVVQSIDPEEFLEHVDINLLIDAVDVDALLGRVDVGRLLDRVDVDGLLDRVDVGRLLDRVDVDGLLDRVDVGRLLDRIDVNAFMANVDVDALISRVDVNAVAKRAQIGELVAESTSDVAGSALDVGRRQAVALDTLLARTMNRLLGRDSTTMPQGPPALAEADEDVT